MSVHVGCPVRDCVGTIDVEIETRAAGDGSKGGRSIDVIPTRWRTVGDDHNHEHVEREFDR